MPFYGKLITIKRDGSDGSIFPITSHQTVIGTEDSCNIRVNLPNVEEEHCSLQVRNNQIFIETVVADNPVLLNNNAVTDPVVLKSGDVFKIGTKSFRFTTESSSYSRKSLATCLSSSQTNEASKSDNRVKFNTPQPEKKLISLAIAPKTISKFGSSSKLDPKSPSQANTSIISQAESKSRTPSTKKSLETAKSLNGKTPDQKKSIVISTPKSQASRTPISNVRSIGSATATTLKSVTATRKPHSALKFSAKKMQAAPAAFKIAFGTKVKAASPPPFKSERKLKGVRRDALGSIRRLNRFSTVHHNLVPVSDETASTSSLVQKIQWPRNYSALSTKVDTLSLKKSVDESPLAKNGNFSSAFETEKSESTTVEHSATSSNVVKMARWKKGSPLKKIESYTEEKLSPPKNQLSIYSASNNSIFDMENEDTVSVKSTPQIDNQIVTPVVITRSSLKINSTPLIVEKSFTMDAESNLTSGKSTTPKIPLIEEALSSSQASLTETTTPRKSVVSVVKKSMTRKSRNSENETMEENLASVKSSPKVSSLKISSTPIIVEKSFTMGAGSNVELEKSTTPKIPMIAEVLSSSQQSLAETTTPKTSGKSTVSLIKKILTPKSLRKSRGSENQTAEENLSSARSSAQGSSLRINSTPVISEKSSTVCAELNMGSGKSTEPKIALIGEVLSSSQSSLMETPTPKTSGKSSVSVVNKSMTPKSLRKSQSSENQTVEGNLSSAKSSLKVSSLKINSTSGISEKSFTIKGSESKLESEKYTTPKIPMIEEVLSASQSILSESPKPKTSTKKSAVSLVKKTMTPKSLRKSRGSENPAAEENLSSAKSSRKVSSLRISSTPVIFEKSFTMGTGSNLELEKSTTSKIPMIAEVVSSSQPSLDETTTPKTATKKSAVSLVKKTMTPKSMRKSRGSENPVAEENLSSAKSSEKVASLKPNSTPMVFEKSSPMVAELNLASGKSTKPKISIIEKSLSTSQAILMETETSGKSSGSLIKKIMTSESLRKSHRLENQTVEEISTVVENSAIKKVSTTASLKLATPVTRSTTPRKPAKKSIEKAISPAIVEKPKKLKTPAKTLEINLNEGHSKSQSPIKRSLRIRTAKPVAEKTVVEKKKPKLQTDQAASDVDESVLENQAKTPKRTARLIKSAKIDPDYTPATEKSIRNQAPKRVAFKKEPTPVKSATRTARVATPRKPAKKSIEKITPIVAEKPKKSITPAKAKARSDEAVVKSPSPAKRSLRSRTAKPAIVVKAKKGKTQPIKKAILSSDDQSDLEIEPEVAKKKAPRLKKTTKNVDDTKNQKSTQNPKTKIKAAPSNFDEQEPSTSKTARVGRKRVATDEKVGAKSPKNNRGSKKTKK